MAELTDKLHQTVVKIQISSMKRMYPFLTQNCPVGIQGFFTVRFIFSSERILGKASFDSMEKGINPRQC